MSQRPVSLGRRAMPAFFKYLHKLTREQIRGARTSPGGRVGKGTPVWIPISLSSVSGSPKANGGLEERHPGWWFKEVFSGLTKEEKVAWLELLTLAVASTPRGMAFFCSVGQLASWLGVNESGLASALEKAMKRLLIEIREAVFIPEPGKSVQLRKVTKAELPASSQKLIEEGSKKILRYYAIAFPGFHADNTNLLEQELCSKWEQDTGYCRMNPTELDHHLEEPFHLLQERLAAGKETGFRTHTIIESPMGNPSSIKLPQPPVYFIDSEAEVEDRLSPKYWDLLPISKADAPAAAVQLQIARMSLMSLFARHMKIVRPDVTSGMCPVNKK